MENAMTVNQEPKTFQRILTQAREWEAEHNPFDRTTRLPLFQYIIEEGTGGALVPFKPGELINNQGFDPKAINLLPHAHDQLLERLDFAKRTYDKLPSKLNILAVNWLIQNHYDKDVLLRIQDGNQARAFLSGQYEPFDNLELLSILEPFCGDAVVRWEYQDDLTIHLSLTWKKTVEEVKVGDIIERGIHISNSEVGVRSVTIAGYVFRLKCKNGLIGRGDGGGVRRFRHTGDADRTRDMVKAAVEETYLESQKILTQFKASITKAIEDPYTYLERIAKDKTNDMTQDQFKAAMDAYLLEPDPTLFGVTNALTRAAQNFQGEGKYDLERLGTKVLAEGLAK